ncbi:B12-binding domain-containing radical SAM protein [Desulfolutivibrio sulfoxidireducens]|uniref:B12-binding domain-containing radical SAM protein n=1 Tax=Desulfolutivibrio sulfoxidireducens TaxID=2773299 RepID=UPI00159D9E00|nr:radical SAM protein [Desulfolutivibrio sulfoxidireducens]QLA17459.1 radical SAM protein [Desulfolutivibrio sulfoxidireducens]
MKILLVTPPGLRLMNPATLESDLLPPKTWVPLGIASLAGALRVAGFEAEPRDLHDAGWDEVERILAASGADVVGVSCFTFERGNARRTAALAKKVLPWATVVMGGPHATFFPHQVMADGNVDVVVLGEGELTMVSLAARLERGMALSDVPGIVHRDGPAVRTTAARARSENLDAFPFPVTEAFDLQDYKSPEIPPVFQDLPGTHVISSRGCPFTCRFCSVNRFFEGKWAFRSPLNVLDELEVLTGRLGVRHVYFSDDLFSLRPQRVIDICRGILDRGIEIAWMAETRVDCVDAGMLGWMRRAGCYRVYYGVESGSPAILRAMNKRFTPRQVAEAFDMTHRAGIEPCCFLMVGYPGESPRTISETVELVNAIRPAAMPTIGITTILPGTEIYELSKRQGLLTDDFWLSDAPPPLYTGEYDIDGLISLQMMLTRGVCPELYEQLCDMGFDEGYFRLRGMWASDAGSHEDPDALAFPMRDF